MPKKICDWLKAVLNDHVYEELIWWVSKEKALIAIHWKHASYDDYDENDSLLFKKWAVDNSKY